jgi:hypothetical protein
MKKLIRARFLTAIFALVMAFVFAAGLGGAAFAAVGDVVGLTDFNVLSSPRPDVYDSNEDEGGYFELQIAKLVENASGDADLQFFSSAEEADPDNFTWTLNFGAGDSEIDLGTAEARELSPGIWYYYVIAYGYGGNVGPESWRLAYSYDSVVTSSDFTFVTTDFRAQDSGTVNNIKIEFYRGDPKNPPVNFITSGDFSAVGGTDDHIPTLPAPPQPYGRSYATALDAVAHGFAGSGSEKILNNYAKTEEPPVQFLVSITDLNDNTYEGSGSGVNETGWMYAVYYPAGGTTYARDPDSYFVGPDDYKLKENALVIWAIGRLGDYSGFFPNTINR